MYEIVPNSEAWILFVNVAVETTPTPEPTATQPMEPGRMVQIHEDMCDPDQPGPLAFELTDLRGSDAVDAERSEVVIAESSSTSVPVTLDELTQNDYVIIAYADDDDTTPVACTEIADVMNDSGELVLGLREINDSAYTGIAYLDQGEDTSRTDVSVFLAEGLAEETPTATPGP